jgi:hypothetical protein
LSLATLAAFSILLVASLTQKGMRMPNNGLLTLLKLSLNALIVITLSLHHVSNWASLKKLDRQ